MNNKNNTRPEVVLFWGCLGILAALAFNYWQKYDTNHPQLKYIPPSSKFILFTSPIENLWEDLSNHGSPYVQNVTKEQIQEYQNKDTDDIERLSEMAIYIKSILHGRIENSNDLKKYGIDPTVGLAAGLGSLDHPESFLLTMPLVDKHIFADSLASFYDTEPDTLDSYFIKSVEYSLLDFGDLYLCFPDSEIAVIANDKDALIESLKNVEANRIYYLNNDSFNHRISSLRTSSSSEGWISFKMLIASASIPDLMGTINLNSETLSLNLSMILNDLKAKVFDQLLDEGSEALVSRYYFSEFSGFTTVVKDKNIIPYIELVKEFAPDFWENSVKENYPDFWDGYQESGFFGVMEKVSQTENIQEFGVIMLGVRGTFPDIVTKIRMSKADADSLIFSLQKELRLERDDLIINNSIQAFQDSTSRLWSHSVDSIKTLPLREENFPFWSKYQYQRSDNRTSLVTSLTESDFDNADYQFYKDGYEFNYIHPPITDNDFLYRYEKDEYEDVDRKALLNDEFRLCSVYIDSSLFVGLDYLTLENLLQTTFENQHFRNVTTMVEAGKYKLVSLLEPDWMMNQGLFSSDEDYQSFTQNFLLDLSSYELISIFLNTKPDKNELAFKIELFRE